MAFLPHSGTRLECMADKIHCLWLGFYIPEDTSNISWPHPYHHDILPFHIQYNRLLLGSGSDPRRTRCRLLYRFHLSDQTGIYRTLSRWVILETGQCRSLGSSCCRRHLHTYPDYIGYKTLSEVHLPSHLGKIRTLFFRSKIEICQVGTDGTLSH